MAEILRVDFHSGEVFNKPARGAAKREHPSSKAGQFGLPNTNAGRTRPFDFEEDGCGAEAVGGRVVSLGLEDDGHTTYAPDYLDREPEGWVSYTEAVYNDLPPRPEGA
jgi:hypothetical protein